MCIRDSSLIRTISLFRTILAALAGILHIAAICSLCVIGVPVIRLFSIGLGVRIPIRLLIIGIGCIRMGSGCPVSDIIYNTANLCNIVF